MSGKLERRSNGTAPLIDLFLKGYTIDRVVLESTRGLHRRLERPLRDARLSVSVVNPERIWAYRERVGQAGKRDHVDACLIAEYAATTRPAEPGAERRPAGYEGVLNRPQPTASRARVRSASSSGVTPKSRLNSRPNWEALS